jgi:hypothetical protein
LSGNNLWSAQFSASLLVDGSYMKTTTLNFIGASSIHLTAGTGKDIVTADGGKNTFISAANGTLTATGGSGADAYRLGVGSFGLTVNDFSVKAIR